MASAGDLVLKKNALRISLIAISSVFVFEFVAGIITNSLALLTDSVHALFDAIITVILIVAVRLASKPRDKEHTYGHGKIEVIGSFIGGTALFVVAIFFIYEAFERLSVGGTAALVVPGTIGFAAVIYTLGVHALRITILGRADRKSGATSLRAELYHATADFGSTSIALLGLWLATAGIYAGDAAAAIVLGAFLAFLSSRFAYQNAVELTDSIHPKMVAKVKQAALATEGVLGCTDIRMRKVGKEMFVDTTISLKADMSFEKAHETSAQVERNIAKALEIDDLRNITVHFEPVFSPEHLPPESIIERAAARVSGVKGVHNIIASRVGGTGRLEVSLHIQVNRSATLSEAHAISSAVEDSIKAQLKDADVTVHLEPLMPGLASGVQPLADKEVRDSIMQIIMASPEIKKVSRVATFRTEDDVLKIDVDCTFSPEASFMIEHVHEHVTDIEKKIRRRYPGSIVTIHAEPS